MILTCEKQLLDVMPNVKYVTPKTIVEFEGNKEVNIIVATRQLAISCEKIDLPNLQFIQLLSAGFDGVDIEGFRKKGITISNAASVYGVGMAEYVVYAMLIGAKTIQQEY